MRKHISWMLSAALMTTMITPAGFAQAPSTATKPIALPVKVQIVFTRGNGDKKVSFPYSFFTSSSGETSSLRIGGEVPVGASFEQIGTQIDSSVTSSNDGRLNLVLNFKGRDLSPEGKPREANSTNTVTLRDGEPARFTGSDDGGGAFTLDVTLTVVK